MPDSNKQSNQDDNQKRMHDAYKEGEDFAEELLRQFNFLHNSSLGLPTQEPPPYIDPNVVDGYMQGVEFLQNMLKSYPDILASEKESRISTDDTQSERENVSSVLSAKVQSDSSISADLIDTCKFDTSFVWDGVKDGCIDGAIPDAVAGGIVGRVLAGIPGLAAGATFGAFNGCLTGGAIGGTVAILNAFDQQRECNKQQAGREPGGPLDMAINKTINKGIGGAISGMNHGIRGMVQGATDKAIAHATTTAILSFRDPDNTTDCSISLTGIVSETVAGAINGARVGKSLKSAAVGAVSGGLKGTRHAINQQKQRKKNTQKLRSRTPSPTP